MENVLTKQFLVKYETLGGKEAVAILPGESVDQVRASISPEGISRVISVEEIINQPNQQ